MGIDKRNNQEQYQTHINLATNCCERCQNKHWSDQVHNIHATLMF